MTLYFKAPLLDVESQPRTSSRIFKVGIALAAGSCLVLLSVMAISAYGPTLNNASAAESTNLIGMPSLRLAKSPVGAMTVRNLPGGGIFKDLALAGLQESNVCVGPDPARDVSAYAGMKSMMATMKAPERAQVTAMADKAESLLKAGVVAPLGFWDPWGLSAPLSEGTLLFYREAEIKHGRVCMLATLGILVMEKYHPLFGGNIDVAAVKVFQAGDLATFWPIAFFQFLVAAGFEEFRTSLPTLEGRAFSGMKAWQGDKSQGSAADLLSAKGGRIPGDLGFVPLGIKPKKEADLIAMQNKEILNGRLAMIALAGIVAQEMVTGQPINPR
jgi:hypothetical protein